MILEIGISIGSLASLHLVIAIQTLERLLRNVHASAGAEKIGRYLRQDLPDGRHNIQRDNMPTSATCGAPFGGHSHSHYVALHAALAAATPLARGCC